jgi:hypothetical protein
MALPLQRRSAEQPVLLHSKAMDNLAFIRDTMERSSVFTGVPGWGTAATGCLALGAATLASSQTSPEAWLQVWLSTAVVVMAIAGTTTTRKLKKAPATEGSLRKFGFGLAPPLAAGAVLTAVLTSSAQWHLLPGVWLLLYGVGVVTAGAYSIRIVPVMGFCFAALGVGAFLSPATWADGWLAARFGGLHIIFGLIIARHHGG